MKSRKENGTTTENSFFDRFRKKKPPSKLEQYRATVEPIKQNQLARKAGLPGYFTQQGQAQLPQELKQINIDIILQIADLQNDIKALSKSCLASLYQQKIRIKKVKKTALNALLSAKDFTDLQHIAAVEQQDPEVLAGIRSRTARLFERIRKIPKPKLKI